MIIHRLVTDLVQFLSFVFLNLFPVIKIYVQKWFLTIYNNIQIGIELLHVEN